MGVSLQAWLFILNFYFLFFFILLVQVNLQLLSLLNTGIINLSYTWLKIGLIQTFRFLRLLLTLPLAVYKGPVLSLCPPRWSLQLLMGVRVLRPAPSRWQRGEDVGLQALLLCAPAAQNPVCLSCSPVHLELARAELDSDMLSVQPQWALFMGKYTQEISDTRACLVGKQISWAAAGWSQALQGFMWLSQCWGSDNLGPGLACAVVWCCRCVVPSGRSTVKSRWTWEGP